MNARKKSLTVIKTLVIGKAEKEMYKKSFDKFLEKHDMKDLPVYLLSEFLQENELCYDDIVISENVSDLNAKYPENNIMTNGLNFQLIMELIQKVHDIKYTPNEISSAFIEVFDSDKTGKIHIDQLKSGLETEAKAVEFETIIRDLEPDPEGFFDYKLYSLRTSFRN